MNEKEDKEVMTMMADAIDLKRTLEWLEQSFTWWRIECESENLYRVIAVLLDDGQPIDILLCEEETLDELIQRLIKQGLKCGQDTDRDNADPIIFQIGNVLWQQMASGQKTWAEWRHDLTDDRIYRLSWYRVDKWLNAFEPIEKYVGFQNEETGKLLRCHYRGMEFDGVAPGRCRIVVGDLVGRYGKKE
ncbi:MAG: hypothetical protein ABIH46_04060 [Chloroflexota bacterium]